MNSKGYSLAAATACLLIAAPLSAQTNVTGDWDVTIQSPHGANTVRVTFKQDGEKVSGVLKSMIGDLPFQDGTIDGSDLKFSFTIPFQGMPLDVMLSGVVDGDSIAGKAVFGTIAEGEWTGTKAGAVAAVKPAASAQRTRAPASAGLTGKWEIAILSDAGEFPLTADLIDAGGKISGTIAGESGPIALTGTYDGNTLKLSFTTRTPDGDLPIALSGDVTGDTIAGTADLGDMGEGEWTARRKS